jgi:hypothetical protein
MHRNLNSVWLPILHYMNQVSATHIFDDLCSDCRASLRVGLEMKFVWKLILQNLDLDLEYFKPPFCYYVAYFKMY